MDDVRLEGFRSMIGLGMLSAFDWEASGGLIGIRWTGTWLGKYRKLTDIKNIQERKPLLVGVVVSRITAELGAKKRPSARAQAWSQKEGGASQDNFNMR